MDYSTEFAWFNNEVRLLALNNFGPWKTEAEAREIVDMAHAETIKEAKEWKRPYLAWNGAQRRGLAKEMVDLQA